MSSVRVSEAGAVFEVGDLETAMGMTVPFRTLEAAAAEATGIGIVSLPGPLVAHPDHLLVAPDLFSMTCVTQFEAGTCRQSAVGLPGEERRRRRGLLFGKPGHGGAIGTPPRACRFKAVGKTGGTAVALYLACRGCKGAERVAAFPEFHKDVVTGAFPTDGHVLTTAASHPDPRTNPVELREGRVMIQLT